MILCVLLLECSSKTAFIRHLSYSHHILKWIIMVNPETLIRNFTFSKYCKDFVALNPNLLPLEATAVKNSSMSHQNLTPEKHSSPQTPHHNQVAVEAIRPSPVTPTHRTPGKRSQNRMVIIG